MADKKGRIAEIIQRNVSEIILFKLNNNICKFSSIHKVDLSLDYSHCKIYVSHIQKEKVSSLVNYLNSNASLIRSMLSKKLDIYKTPSLLFLGDDLFDEETHIQEVITSANKKKKKTLNDL